jgi:hypothetical protein
MCCYTYAFIALHDIIAYCVLHISISDCAVAASLGSHRLPIVTPYYIAYIIIHSINNIHATSSTSHQSSIAIYRLNNVTRVIVLQRHPSIPSLHRSCLGSAPCHSIYSYHAHFSSFLFGICLLNHCFLTNALLFIHIVIQM